MARFALCMYMCGKVYQSLDHLGISSLVGTLLACGHEVKEFYIFEDEEDQAVREIIEYKPGYIGFSIYAANIMNSLRVCSKLRSEIDKFHLIFGGPTASYEAYEILKNEEVVDIIVKGEGERTLVDLIEFIELSKPLKDCAGIAWRDENGNIHDNPERPLLDDLDQLAFPVRQENKTQNVVHFNLETSRGCLANCSFCASKYVRLQNGKVWRGKSIKRVMKEIEESIEKYGVSRFNIVDLSFEDPGNKGRMRIEEFANEIINRNLKIKFTVHFRAEFVKELNLPLIEKLIKVGMTKVSLGIEAGNQHSLNVYNKTATVEDNIRAVKLLSDIKIPLIHGFMNFNPYTTFEDLEENARFLVDCGWDYRIEDFCSRVEILPGTPLKKRLIEDGLIPEDFNYKSDIIGYSFQNERVGWLCNALSGLRKRRKVDIDFGLYTESLIFEIEQTFSRGAPSDKCRNSFEEFKDFYDKTKKHIGDTNCRFFTKAMETAKEAVSKEKFEEDYLRLEDEFIGDNISSGYNRINEKKIQLIFLINKNGIKLNL